jgi:hypothetical protein
MKNLFRLCAALTCCLCFFPGILFALELMQPVEASGKAAVDASDFKKSALQDAFRNAVQEAVGVQVKSDTLVKDSALIHDKIILKSDGYIKKYEILSESEINNEFVVKIKAWIGSGELNKDLFINGIDVSQVYDWIGKPRLMVIMQDLVDDKISSTPYTQNSVEGLFKSKGITIIDSQQLKNIQGRDVQLAVNDPQQAIALGNRLGAEIIIIGKSVSKLSRELDIAGFHHFFYTTQLDAKAYRTSNAEVLMSKIYAEDQTTDTSAMGKHDAAVRSVLSVIKQNSTDIVYQVVKNWFDGMTKSNMYQIIISGIKGSDLTTFISKLTKQPDVLQVQRRSFNRGVAEIDVEYNGIQSSLLESIESDRTIPLALVNEEPHRITFKREK